MRRLPPSPVLDTEAFVRAALAARFYGETKGPGTTEAVAAFLSDLVDNPEMPPDVRMGLGYPYDLEVEPWTSLDSSG